MATNPTIAFIGFGEAGFHIARGLLGAGVGAIYAYDINAHTPSLGDRILYRAAEADVHLVNSSAAIADAGDIIFSVVTPDRAMEAAAQTVPHLSSRHLYVDFNSVSPERKQSIAALVAGSGARFVEAAIMSPVPSRGHRVPMLLGGAHAAAFAELMAPYQMNLEVISHQIGAASAAKMSRSVIVKGLEAVFLESVLAAVPYGADERVFATLDESFPGVNWKRMASYMVGRVVQHGERRARELEEVAVALRAIGVEPLMTEAAQRRQAWCAALNLLDQFDDKAPEDYRAVVRAIADKQSAAAAEVSGGKNKADR